MNATAWLSGEMELRRLEWTFNEQDCFPADGLLEVIVAPGLTMFLVHMRN